MRPMRALSYLLIATVITGAGCGDNGDPAGVDGAIDAVDPDASVAVPRPGFGVITGMCGVVGDAELDGTTPAWFQGELTFANRYDDPAERDLLTPGGREIILDGNAGGSS